MHVYGYVCFVAIPAFGFALGTKTRLLVGGNPVHRLIVERLQTLGPGPIPITSGRELRDQLSGIRKGEDFPHRTGGLQADAQVVNNLHEPLHSKPLAEISVRDLGKTFEATTIVELAIRMIRRHKPIGRRKQFKLIPLLDQSPPQKPAKRNQITALLSSGFSDRASMGCLKFNSVWAFQNQG